MPDQTYHNPDTPPPGQIDPGTYRGTGESIHMDNEKDRAMVRNSIKKWGKRWKGITPEVKDKIVGQLARAADKAVDVMESADDQQTALSAVSAVSSIGRTMVAIEGQNQADEHLEDKNERLDAGKPTENVNHGVKFIVGVDGSGI